MARRGTYVVARVFADVGDIPINPHRHLPANQIRLLGMINHPPTTYVNSMRLLSKFQKSFPLERFVTHEFPVNHINDAWQLHSMWTTRSRLSLRRGAHVELQFA